MGYSLSHRILHLTCLTILLAQCLGFNIVHFKKENQVITETLTKRADVTNVFAMNPEMLKKASVNKLFILRVNSEDEIQIFIGNKNNRK